MKIIIPHNVHQKIMYWVNKADFEVSGFGKVVHADGVFTVTDAILLKQEGGGAHTDIDPLSLSKAQFELKDQPGDLRFWWHSHVKMDAFMSGTDKATIKELGANGWVVAAVFNQRYEYETAISYMYNTSMGTTLKAYSEKVPLEIAYSELTDEEKVLLDAQFDAHVTEKFTSLYSSSEYWNGKRWDSQQGKWVDVDEDKELPGTQGTLLTGPSSFKTMSDSKYKEWTEEEEAQALGMNVKKYRKLLKNATMDELVAIDDKIHNYFQTKYGWDDNERTFSGRIY